jgi:2-hydroxycyclohexanecarboxyl-CoA dehydrogenase
MQVTYDFAGQVVVITGGGHGIGKGLALAVARAGGRVLVGDVSWDYTDEEQAETGGNLAIERVDVGDFTALRRYLGDIQRQYGQVDAYVHAAAIQPRHAVHELPLAEWQRVMDVNLTSVMVAAQTLLPEMMARRRGALVAFTSGLATTGWPRASAYATTKAGLAIFMKSLAKEVAPYGIRANVVAPGITNTRLFTEPNSAEEQEFFRVRGGGVGTVDDVVPLLLFLISDASASLSGTVLSREIILPSVTGSEAS